ncbi:MAG: clostripain-related cysteine peptidase [Oscillospiraceae bacterium]
MKKICGLLLATAMLFSLAACGEEAAEPTKVPSKSVVTTAGSETDTEWAIYWYLCGSDLESNYGAGTSDLMELTSVELPENVKIVIQTGGAATWQNDIVSEETLQRYVYDSEGLNLIEEQPSASMGDPNTLTDFLTFAAEHYPAKHTMVNFWNHGGGSVAGVAFDELYEMDSLTLPELTEALGAVFTPDAADRPLDIVGLDTCLMATVDTAAIFAPFADFLVASEEVEPGNGWLYSGIAQALADDPAIAPLALAQVICDTFVTGCEAVETADNITLSVTDLGKIGPLLDAYEAFGKGALAAAAEDPAFFTAFSKTAGSIENYGGNTREQGYSDMADLGSLAQGSAETLPEEAAALDAALADCIAYKVGGKYRQGSTGLACYYSYSGDLDTLTGYVDKGVGTAFKYFYTYGLTGELPQDGMDYLSEMEYNTLPELLTLDSVSWEDMPVTVDDEGCATMTLGPDAADVLSSIGFQLYYADPEEDIMLCLGSDNDIIADWENGVFKDNFRGVWGSIDGALCYMEISYEGEDYNLYSVPILLNGEEYNLSVVYDFSAAEYYIEGARKGMDESGAADKNLRKLKVGDEIQTIHYAAALSDDSEELTAVPVDTIKVTEDTAFSEMDLGDGLFVMMFDMMDSQGTAAQSAAFTFEVVDGEIITSVE